MGVGMCLALPLVLVEDLFIVIVVSRDAATVIIDKAARSTKEGRLGGCLARRCAQLYRIKSGSRCCLRK